MILNRFDRYYIKNFQGILNFCKNFKKIKKKFCEKQKKRKQKISKK